MTDIKRLSLLILWFAELIISVRLLLFCIPVMLSKYSSRDFSMNESDDRFIILLTISSLIWLIVSLASIAGHKFWKLLHYAAAAAVTILTFLLSQLGAAGSSLNISMVLPFIFSIIVVLLAGIISYKMAGGERA